jgi:hypothetical protein
MIFKLIFFVCLQLHATGYPLDPLHSNGAVFVSGDERMPLRCLDAPNLLQLAAPDQNALLDKAAAAGFNSVSFAAPVFGSGSFCEKLGSLNAERISHFKSLVEAMETRRLYAFPVLWDSSSVQAFEKIGGGEAKFFNGNIQNQWQAWLTRQLLKSTAEGISLSSTTAVGGWILYRGPWPGPKSRGQDQTTGDGPGPQAFTAPLRNWLLWQIRALRQGGAMQLAGAGFLLKGELGEKAPLDDPSLDQSQAQPPVAEMKPDETTLPDDASLDELPPLPGTDKQNKNKIDDDALTPWDLEGVDWDSVGRALEEIPVATGIDFMELTLDTEDWYRVGDAMSTMAETDMQVPLAWRHDWRTVSRYERQKRLEAPEGLAGLIGPWPDNDWPDPGEFIWPVQEKGKTYNKALAFKYMEVLRIDGKPVLGLHLNRACDVRLKWGSHWPPNNDSASLDLALVHKLGLRGAKFGQNIMIYARAKSKRFGRAVLRCRWVDLIAPPLLPKNAKAKKY